MNYQQHYSLLIERARTRLLTCYLEKHHIIPRCMNGTNDAINIVSLTPEEHYLAHLLLIKIYPDNHLLLYAAQMMTVENKSNASVSRPHNKMYGWVKRKISIVRSAARKGYKHSDETRAKMSRNRKGKGIGAKHTPEHKEKVRLKLIGRPGGKWSKESREKMSERRLGTKSSEETKRKISEGGKGRKCSEETIAKMRKPKSEEHRKRISEARKRMFADKDKLR